MAIAPQLQTNSYGISQFKFSANITQLTSLVQ